MKFKIICVLFTVITISALWHYSPQRQYQTRPSVEVIMPKIEDVHDTVVTRGSVEEEKKTSVRLDKTATVDKLYVSVGDYVGEGSILMDVSEKENELSDIATLKNFLPKIEDISDITKFYAPKKVEEPTTLTPEVAAPISGVVTDIAVNEGETALGLLPIITISDFNQFCIRTSVSELYVKDIRLGQRAELTGEAFGNKKYIATVKEISPTASKKTSLTGSSETTVDVLLSVVSKDTDLRPGYSVTARIFTDTHNDAITVPYTCIFQEGSREYVYVVDAGKISKKAIRTGFELDDRVEVCSGIEEHDLIVKDPDNSLKESMAVKVVK